MIMRIIHTISGHSIHRYFLSPFHSSVGHAHLSFPLQACEQLNAWLGGFQSILNKMTPGNFDWSMHALLFLHTERIINAQVEKAKRTQGINTDDEEANEAMEEEGFDVEQDDEEVFEQ
jgi:hypothetical protein